MPSEKASNSLRVFFSVIRLTAIATVNSLQVWQPHEWTRHWARDHARLAHRTVRSALCRNRTRGVARGLALVLGRGGYGNCNGRLPGRTMTVRLFYHWAFCFLLSFLDIVNI